MEKSLDDQLVSTFFSVSRLMREKLAHTKIEEASSMLQIKTLGIVAEKKNPSMKEIADCLHILSPSATDIINRLVKGGMLLRIKDASDGRIVRLALTPQGKALLSSGFKKIARKVKDTLGVLTEREKIELNELLAKIIERTSS